MKLSFCAYSNQQLEVNSKTERKPLLSGRKLKDLNDLKPFFDQLSIYAYEGVYSLLKPDLRACEEDLLIDLFD